MHPDTKFIRARASSLGFTSSSNTSKPYEDEIYDEKNRGDTEDEGDVDLDMLPTLLVYRDGELVHNWVRVDWEAGDSGIRDLLERYVFLRTRDHSPCLFSWFVRHKILPPRGNACSPDDDDDDLQWSEL